MDRKPHLRSFLKLRPSTKFQSFHALLGNLLAAAIRFCLSCLTGLTRLTCLICVSCLACLTCFTCLTCLTACNRQPESHAVTLALIPMGSTDEFWKSVHAGGVQASQKFGVNIIWQGPIRRDDRTAQIDVVENMIVRGVKGIILAPIDNMALRAPVEDAYRNKIPVVIIDSNLNTDKSISFVATDNYKGGVMAGEHMIQILGAKGRVAMLRNVEGSASTDNRERGFLDTLKKEPGIKVVSSNLYAGATTESAYRASENLLAPLKLAKGDVALDGIFCPNESCAFGMLRALQDGDLTGKVKFIGFDSSDKLVEGLKKGHIDALVVQDPVKMGYLGVEKLVDYLNGKSVEKKIDVPATLVTRQNLSDPTIKELVSPDIKKWLKE